MSFHKINEGGARRDDGVVVQIKHADYLEYKDGGRTVEVSMGYSPSIRQITVYASDISNWSGPDPEEIISEIKKNEIIRNLREALSLLKGNFVVD